MANQEHLDILKRGKQGVEVWNKWREEHLEIQPDLRDADLTGAYLRKANLSRADLRGVDLRNAYLRRTNLEGADLKNANLEYANLRRADLPDANLEGTSTNLRRTNLSMANLKGTNLRRTNLRRTNLSNAILRDAHLEGADLTGANLEDADLGDAHLEGADLTGAVLIRTKLQKATLTNCRVYGIAVWDVDLTEAEQSNLIITDSNSKEPIITVDNLKVAQFILLLKNNAEIRDAIDAIARKAVLILGRFTPERKAILDALKEALRASRYLPILFDFDNPSSQDLTETVSTLAHLSRFILVDLTDPSSAPYEIGSIASNHIRPIQALFRPSEEAKRVFAMFPDLVRRYHWVLPPYEYQDQEHLLASLQEKVIEPAEQKAQKLERR